MALVLVSMITMFELFGRKERKFDMARLKGIHKLSGFAFILLFLFIAYQCITFLGVTKMELSSRAAIHSVLALVILVLLGIKLSFIRVYRHYYEQAKVIGIVIAVLTFGLAGSSGGYYLLVSEFGTDTSFDTLIQYSENMALQKKNKETVQPDRLVHSDAERIEKGRALFDAKCKFCHNAHSTETIVGPGLKDILRNTKLPVSRKSATPDSIKKQLLQPFNRMPAFDYLSEEEIKALISYLNTL